MAVNKPKVIAIRADSSSRIGSGHVMRCLTLASLFSKENYQIIFLCKQHHGNINALIQRSGFEIKLLSKPVFRIEDEKDASLWLGCHYQDDAKECKQLINGLHLKYIDLLIVDHYSLDFQWQNILKPLCKKIMVIDDLANRKHHCDILLDQTYGRTKQDYKDLTPKNCDFLIGKQYMLLRDEFLLLRNKSQVKRALYIKEHSQKSSNEIVTTNILICMGGTDPDNISQLSLNALKCLNEKGQNITSNVIISSQSKHLPSLVFFCNEHAWANIIVDCNNIAELMVLADLAIGASGTTAWERCCLGLPCLTTINAENQQLIAHNLAKTAATINLGWHENVVIECISSAIKNLLDDIDTYEKMTNACFNVCDGKGTIKVAEHIIKTSLHRKLNCLDEK